MHFIIISGLLGVDRSSAIVDMIEVLNEGQECKIALILNDFTYKRIGEEVRSKYDIQVKELKGGCISCSLKTDLVGIVKEIQIKADPDVILLGPSGATDPETIVNTLRESNGLAISKISCIVLLDAELFSKTWQMFERPLHNHLRFAKLVLAKNVNRVSAEDYNFMNEKVISLGYPGLIEQVKGEHLSFDNISKLFI